MVAIAVPLPIKWAHGAPASSSMVATLTGLVDRLDRTLPVDTCVIRWSTPVPAFGDLARSQVATLGLNPSSREFVDVAGRELDGQNRRFPTLTSLSLPAWSEADASHLRTILSSCRTYFQLRPYDAWFRKLDAVVSGTGASFYDPSRPACHLDLVPYATTRKWMELRPYERTRLLHLAGDSLGRLLRDSPVRLVILNGASVVEHFQNTSEVRLERLEMCPWSLPRRSRAAVRGVGFRGTVEKLLGVQLDRPVQVLGFNHNLQSSYGVTRDAVVAIREWIASSAKDVVL